MVLAVYVTDFLKRVVWSDDKMLNYVCVCVCVKFPLRRTPDLKCLICHQLKLKLRRHLVCCFKKPTNYVEQNCRTIDNLFILIGRLDVKTLYSFIQIHLKSQLPSQ